MYHVCITFDVSSKDKTCPLYLNDHMIWYDVTTNYTHGNVVDLACETGYYFTSLSAVITQIVCQVNLSDVTEGSWSNPPSELECHRTYVESWNIQVLKNVLRPQ